MLACTYPELSHVQAGETRWKILRVTLWKQCSDDFEKGSDGKERDCRRVRGRNKSTEKRGGIARTDERSDMFRCLVMMLGKI